jgi:peptidyl-prolyl cis-trans isomerase D
MAAYVEAIKQKSKAKILASAAPAKTEEAK